MVQQPRLAESKNTNLDLRGLFVLGKLTIYGNNPLRGANNGTGTVTIAYSGNPQTIGISVGVGWTNSFHCNLKSRLPLINNISLPLLF